MARKQRKHKLCPKCLNHIVRFGASPKELCGFCDPKHETRNLRRRGWRIVA